MADLGFILVKEWPGNGATLVKDDYGSVILFRTREDAESEAYHGEKPMPLVRWRKPRAKRTDK